jgi:UDPglucose--hexose-1-phosphate uridylyltransferase
MSEFRKDPVSDHWVIIAPNRAHRPEQFGPGTAERASRRCPFCRGHEQDTPEAVATYMCGSVSRTPAGRLGETPPREVDDGAWQVRVVPNLYPAVGDDEPPAFEPAAFYETRPGLGVHEVIIEAPDHIVSFNGLRNDQAALVFRAYRDRLRHLRCDPRIAYGQLFKNCGSSAGASLEHTHSQLIGTPVVPTQVQAELAKSLAYFQAEGQCVFCAMIDEELRTGTRVVTETTRFVAFCPFASQFPYETWILPRSHAAEFDAVQDGELGEIARLVQDVIARLESTLIDPAFNYLIHTSPFGGGPYPFYHWHLEILPRLTKTAGFEWGAGDYINTVSPEDAAYTLRSARTTPVGSRS